MSPVDPYGLVGQVLDGQFRIDAPIGEGGFSVVYRGHHLGLDEPVAIKCLKLQGQLNSAMVEAFVQRFRDESKIQYKLSQGSLYIARTVAAGTTMAPATMALVPYMVLEWLEGFTLAAELRARRMRGENGRELSVAIRMLDPVAEAMAVAHSMGVVHRDLNPSNIFVAKQPGGGEFKLKVVDFGVAKVVSDHAMSLGKRAATLGIFRLFTPAYGAPEQFNDRLGAIGPWTDVYAFALLCSEVLTDRMPVEAQDYPSLLAMVMDPLVRPTPKTLGVYVGERVEKVLSQALSIDPSLRPTDIGELWGMLKHASIQDEAGRSMPAPPAMSALSFAPPATGMFDVPSSPIANAWSMSTGSTGSTGSNSAINAANAMGRDTSGSQPNIDLDRISHVTSAIGNIGAHDEAAPGTVRISVNTPAPQHRISVLPPTGTPIPSRSSSSAPPHPSEASLRTRKGTYIMTDTAGTQARIDAMLQHDGQGSSPDDGSSPEHGSSSGQGQPWGSNDRLPAIPPPPPMPNIAIPMTTTQRSIAEAQAQAQSQAQSQSQGYASQGYASQGHQPAPVSIVDAPPASFAIVQSRMSSVNPGAPSGYPARPVSADLTDTKPPTNGVSPVVIGVVSLLVTVTLIGVIVIKFVL